MKQLNTLFSAFSAKPLMLLSLFALLPTIASAQSSNINFADDGVKAICVANWDINNDQELSYDEAAAVTDLGTVFKGNKNIISFDELQYFTGLNGISEQAFSLCTNFTSVIMPDNVETIGDYAFDRCCKLASIIIPNTVKSIGDAAFYDCSSLTSITIPSSVTSIEDSFGTCTALTSIIVESGNNIYDSRDECNAIIETSTNTLIAGCQNTVIPNSVTSIGDHAFYGMTTLTSLTIPNSVTSIGVYAFDECSGLTSITIPSSVTDIKDYAFYYCDHLLSVTSMITDPFAIPNAFFVNWKETWTSATLYVPAGCKKKYEETAGWNKFTNIVEMAPTGIAIDETTFPDENFRNWVLAQDYGQDGVLTEAEIAGVTEISVSYQNIANLKGIEYFTALTQLDCYDNLLTSLDLSKNIAIVELRCDDNQLTELDVSKNTNLHQLYCGGNMLTALDISKNTSLITLDCQRNQLGSLDVSHNNALVWLLCWSNHFNETEMGNLIESLPIVRSGRFVVKDLRNTNEQNVITTMQVAVAKSKHWTVMVIDADSNWIEYDADAQEIAPVEQGESIDIGNDIDANTDLDGNVVGDVYYCISSDSGSYDPEEGCLVVTKPTDDSAIDGKDIFGEDFKDNYAGFMFMVAPGKGSIKVEAQTIGNMVLKVKVGDNAPTQMEVNGKTKVSFSYDVSEPTWVFIYGSIGAAGAKGMRKAASTDMLKIYGIEVTSETNGIEEIKDERLKMKDSSLYNLNGQRVISSPSGRPGGVPTKGIYIQNGKKVLVK